MPGIPGEQELHGEGSDDVREKKARQTQVRLHCERSCDHSKTFCAVYLCFWSAKTQHEQIYFNSGFYSTDRFFTLIQIRHAIYLQRRHLCDSVTLTFYFSISGVIPLHVEAS